MTEERSSDRHTEGQRPVVVVGAGPAGLTAALELTKLGRRPLVFEKGDKVGGHARTESYRGFHFDMGGHRFFTKVEEVRKLWAEILPRDFLRRPRLSRIYFNHRWFYYPLRPVNALVGLGLWQSVLILASYVRCQLFPYRREETFEHWVTNRFGQRLFRIFFKTYTEKVWGIPCSELKAEWAAQRIKGLSLATAVLRVFFAPKVPIKTLIGEFDYPRLGPGMMWSAMSGEVERRGGTVRLNTDVVRLRRSGRRIDGIVVAVEGREETVPAAAVISSMPVTEMVRKLDPPPPPEVLAAADGLAYRDFLTVCLIVDAPALFPDNWIYVHDPAVQVARIQNFKNWSADMVPDPAKTSLGLEYFCTEGDPLWTSPDEALVALATREVERIGLARAADVEGGCVFRVPKAYPIYDSAYRRHLDTIRAFVDGFENLQTVGRNGLHRYNNQDHAMLTGLLAARNLAGGARHDVWEVNTEEEYLEEAREAPGAAEPEVAAALTTAPPRIFRKLDRVALGVSLGTTTGVALSLATLISVAAGDPGVQGLGLGLFGQYFPGYRVSLAGSLLGLPYGFFAGFAMGWSFALTRNAATFVFAALIHRRAEWELLRKLFDYF
jgi:protoporphyrinogen oxidase